MEHTARQSGEECKRLLRGFPVEEPQAVEKPLESSRGPEPSRTTIVPGGVNGGDGRIFAAENSIFQSKNRFFAVFAAGIRRIQAKTGEGGREAENPLGFQVSPLAKLPTAQIVDLSRGTWPGSLLPRPPACQKSFLTSGGRMGKPIRPGAQGSKRQGRALTAPPLNRRFRSGRFRRPG